MNDQHIRRAYDFEPAPLNTRIPHRISRLHNQFHAFIKRPLKEQAQLSVTEWKLISVLNIEAPCSATHIVDITQFDKSQISKSVKRLVERGLVEQTVMRDARQKNLCLSVKGQQIYERMAPAMNAHRQSFVRDISPKDLEVFFKVLAQLEEAMK